MSCVLRASGRTFDADAFLARSAWKPCKVYHRGDPRFRGGKRRSRQNGFNVLVSNAGFDDFEGQKRDAARFLVRHRREIARLVRSPGMEGAVLDFATDMDEDNRLFPSRSFSAALAAAAGAAGLDLEVTSYPRARRKRRRRRPPGRR